MRIIEYLSYSSMSTFEMSKEKFVEQYIYGHKKRISRNMSLGTMLADGMENDELMGNPILDLVMTRLPKYDLADKVVEDLVKGVPILNKHDGKTYKLPVLKDGKELIPLMAKPDTASFDYTKFGEYKTSTRKWSKKMVDESGQLSFYATAIWIATGKVPLDIELSCATTAYNDDGTLAVTGDIYTFKTKRTMVDVIKTITRMKKAWRGINELCNKELL